MSPRTIGSFLGALALISVGAWAVTYAVPGGAPVSSTLLVSAPVPAAPVPAAPLPTVAPATVPAPVTSGVVSTVDAAWVAATSSASGVSPVAVSAYGNAVLTQPEGCRLGWTTLAGIGWVESEQGTIDGRYLAADGRPSTAILGPALDGEGVAAIPATAASTPFHGDARWDHAVGPLQFLPSTWEQWGRDGDADGIADPQDIYDAAVSATAYLCASGQNLTTGPGWSAAILSYNHSDTYVQAVYSAAAAYADRTSG